MIAGLEEKVKEVMIKNAAAEDRINELENQLQLLKQGEEGLQSRDNNWLTISWNDDGNVQAADGVTANLKRVLPVYVKMSQFDKHRRSRERWYSDPFYSNERGYKMCLHVSAAGLGTNVRDKYVTVFIHLMNGEYDDELEWPIKKVFDIKLLNQICDEDHWVQQANFASVTYEPMAERVPYDREIGLYGRGSFSFIPIKRISKMKRSCQYVKNDSIIFAIDHSPWDTYSSSLYELDDENK